jgi:GC-rich sequence DNA-binding factor
MFASKNRTKKFRARRTSEDDEEKTDNNENKPQDEDVHMKDIDTKEEAPQIKPASSAASDLPKKAPQKDTKKSLLTFGDEEEEGETFQIKKVNKPKKVEKKKLTLADLTEENEREQINPNLTMSYNATAGDEYTPEKLAELRKNAKTAPSVKKSEDDIQVVLKNTTPLARREEPIEMTLKRLDESADDDNKGALSMIPTHSQIASIKAKKERMRRYGGNGADFISLNDDDEGKDSALVREGSSDEDDEAFEDNRGSRIQFGDPTKRQKNKKQTLYDELEGSQEEDDDFAQWELDQLKKSGAKKSGKNLPAGIRGAMYDAQMHLPEYKPPLKLEVIPTYEDLAQRLQESLSSMKISNAARKNQLIKVQESIDDAEHTITKCESEMKSYSGQYTFFQEMKSFVLDLTDCLEEKVREIEALEKQFNDSYVAIVNKARKNKQSRKQKEYEKISMALNLPTTVKQENVGEISYQKGNFKQEVLALKREYEQKARAVLEDVYEEFSSLYQVKTKFQQWKWDYTEAYNQANIALFLPQVFSPYMRIETMTWTPFIDKPFFDQMRWWQTLFDYGLKSESDQLEPKDEDNNLIPKLVERNLLNRGSFFFSAIWNPFATKQSASGLEYIKELVVYTAPEKLKDILVQVHITMQAAIDSVNIVLPKETLPDEIKLLCQMQFDSALKLMKNFAPWSEFMPVQTMEKLLVDQLLNMKMIPYLRVISPNDAISLSEEITSALPQEWLKSTSKFMPALSIFIDLLSNKLIGAVVSDQVAITRIVKLVNQFNDKNTAQRLNGQFKITL